MSRFRSLLRLDSLRHVKALANPGVPGPAAQHGSPALFAMHSKVGREVADH